VFVETKNIQAKKTDRFAQCQEQKYIETLMTKQFI
jgi:hypothetical protein